MLWLGAGLAITFALLMLFMPYQFQGNLYRHLYELLRPFGIFFGGAGVLLALSLSGIGLPAWLRPAGGGLVALGLAGWIAANAAASGFSPGLVSYIFMIAGLLGAIRWPRHETTIFGGMYAAILLWLGLLLLLARVGGRAGGTPLWVDALFLVPGVLLAALLWFFAGRRWLGALGMILAAAPLVWYTRVWTLQGNWLGAGITGALLAGALLQGAYWVIGWRLTLPALRRRIVVLTLCAVLLPTLGVGAVAVYQVQALGRHQAEDDLLRQVQGLEEAWGEHSLPRTANGVEYATYPPDRLPAEWAYKEPGRPFEGWNRQGQRQLIVVVRRPDGWALTAVQPAALAYAGAARTAAGILIGALALGAVAVALGLLFSHRITRRLTDLQVAVTEIGAHRFQVGQLLASHSQDEISLLAAAIGQMATSLEAGQEEIQTQNEELMAQSEELRQHNERLIRRDEENEQQLRRTAAVAEIGRLGLTDAPGVALMEIVARRVLEIHGARWCCVLEAMPGGRAYRLLGAAGRLPVEPGRHPLAADSGILSHLRSRAICQPLRGDLPFGELLVGLDRPGNLALMDDHFLAAVANVLANVMERERSRRQKAAEHAVARLLSGSRNLAEAAAAILEAVCSAMDWAMGVVWLIDPERTRLFCLDAWKSPELGDSRLFNVTRGLLLRSGEGIPGTVWQSGRPIWVPDLNVHLVPAFARQAAALADGLTGAVCIPVRSGEQILGVIEFFGYGLGQSEVALEATLETIGRQMAQFMERKRAEEGRERLLREEQVARSRQAFLAESAAALSESLDLQELVERVVQIVLPYLGDCAMVLPTVEGLSPAIAHVVPSKQQTARQMLANLTLSPVADSGYATAMLLQQPYLVAEVTSDLLDRVSSSPLQRELAGFLEIKSYMMVPMQAKGHFLGVLSLAVTESGRRYSRDDLAFAQELANRVAMSLENARLHQALRESEALLSGKREVLEQIAEGRPLRESLTTIARFAEQRVPGGACAILLLDDSGRLLRFAASPSLPPALTEGVSLPAAPAPIMVDLQADQAWGPVRHHLREHGYQAGWSVTVAGPDGVAQGNLTLLQRERRALTKLERQYMEIAAGLAGIALMRHRLEEDRLQKLHSLMQHMAEGVVAIGEDRRLLFTNPAAMRLLGLRADPGQAELREIGLPEPLASKLEAAAQAGATAPDRVTFGWSGVDIEAHVSPVFTQLGRYGAIAVMQDVTAQARFRRLQEAFVANVSHELRGPLASLSATLEALAEGIIPEEQRPRYLGAMLTEMDRLRRLSFEVVDLTRLDSGAITFQRDEVDVGGLIEHVLNKSAQRCIKAGLNLEAGLTGAVALADFDRVDQVLTNLLDNAIQHTPAGGVIRVFAETEGPMVRVSVADTGVGIDQEHLSLIWERFYKVDQARTLRPGGGTGLGLAIVRKLVEGMGGQVDVISAPGQGSTFSFTLPLAPAG